MGGSELPAQEPSPNPQHPVQHASESRGEVNAHPRRCDAAHKCGLTCLSLPQRVALSFDFPFYGHYLRQIIIATGGELCNEEEIRKQGGEHGGGTHDL